jgi:hypothetical protein
VQVARQNFADLFSEERYTNIGLEEFSLSDDGSIWNITLGYDVVLERESPLLAEMGVRPLTRREYKTFEVGAQDGLVKVMKIRNV